jgi:hypothetical protein
MPAQRTHIDPWAFLFMPFQSMLPSTYGPLQDADAGDWRLTIHRHHGKSVFCVPPLFGPLLFDNTDSDARDHCANERSTSLLLLTPSKQLLTPYPRSVPLLPPPQHLHDHRQHRDRNLFPFKIPTLPAGTANGSSPRRSILAVKPCLSRAGIWELY